jgi:outer membrane protein assembly factor BamB
VKRLFLLLPPLACAILIALSAAAPAPAAAADWPAHLGNNRRNAVSAEKLTTPLSEVWVHRPRATPQPAWPPPAKQDFWHGGKRLSPRMALDEAYHVVTAGDSLYYGSSSDHKLYCLKAGSGEVRWSFTAEGPIRLTPAVKGGKVYFGSDDGYAYCLSAADGKLLWKHRPGPADRRLPGNGHVISLWPLRSGVLVENNVAYTCAGIFPMHGVYLCALNANTGKQLWKRKIKLSAQGHMLSDGKRLFVPTGRTGPAVFDLETGKRARASTYQATGTYLVSVGKRVLFQKNRYGRALGAEGTRYTHPADFAVSGGGITYFHGGREITAIRFADYPAWQERRTKLDREIKKLRRKLGKKTKADLDAMIKEHGALGKKIDAAVIWRRKFPLKNRRDPGVASYSWILAGDTLFSGRDGKVVALNAKDGAELWSGKVSGKAYGLTVAGGRLLVSTDSGSIHCFASGKTAARREVKPPAPKPPKNASAAASAEKLLKSTPARKGYCLILGVANADLALELATRSEFKIVVVETDAGRIAAMRKAITAAGLSGRVAVHHISGKKLPYPRYFANLIAVGPRTGASPAEVARVLRPYGGVAAMTGGGSLKAWMQGKQPAETTYSPTGALVRAAPKGAGEWTHQYADPGNTACSREKLTRGPLDLLWFGRPGPRQIIDRHNRPMAPLFKNGRVFVPANERIIALDAYNGTQLWKLDVPGSRRVGIMKDSGQMVVAHDRVYVAVKGECWEVNALSGKRERALKVPQPGGGGKHEWGYLAVLGDRVLGTGQKPGASFDRHCNMCGTLEGDFRPVIASEYLFALDRKTGRKAWLHQGGRILNSTVAAGDGRVYLLESRAAPAGEKKPGRVRIDKLLGARTFLVALNAVTGAKAWETPVKLPYQHIAYLSFARGTVLLTGTVNKGAGKAARVHYALLAFSAKDGKPRWQREFKTGSKPRGSHGEQWQHPAIVGENIYAKAFACKLESGEPIPKWKLGGKGCGTVSASASQLFLRGGNPYMFDIPTRKGAAINKVSRPGCFINIVPAGGIISIPESSAGCTCNYPVQTSFGYVPSK